MSEAAASRYHDLAASFADDPDVTRPERKGFARGALMRKGKLFATLRGDRLLLKLPALRVLQLIGHRARRAVRREQGAADEGMGHR